MFTAHFRMGPEADEGEGEEMSDEAITVYDPTFRGWCKSRGITAIVRHYRQWQLAGKPAANSATDAVTRLRRIREELLNIKAALATGGHIAYLSEIGETIKSVADLQNRLQDDISKGIRK